jgi:flagellar biosynthesis/type III secretory pathway protein FliH
MSSDRNDDFTFPQFLGEELDPTPGELFESFDTEGCPPPGPADPERQMEDARLRIERIEQEAYEKAFVLGERAGREMGEASVAPLVEKLSAALAELSRLHAAVLKESEGELVELAFAVARAVIGREASIAPAVLLENVRKALLLIGDGGRLILRVNPADAATIWRDREALAPYLEGKGELRVEPHDGVDRGGCVAVTDFAEVDATVAGQCEVLREALRSSGEDDE